MRERLFDIHGDRQRRNLPADATGAAIPENKDKTCPAGFERREGAVEMMHLWFALRGRRV